MRASDRGTPPSYADVDIELDVVDRNNKPPLWDDATYGPIHIRENVTVGTVVTSVKARLVSSRKRRRATTAVPRHEGGGPRGAQLGTAVCHRKSIIPPAHDPQFHVVCTLTRCLHTFITVKTLPSLRQSAVLDIFLNGIFFSQTVVEHPANFYYLKIGAVFHRIALGWRVDLAVINGSGAVYFEYPLDS